MNRENRLIAAAVQSRDAFTSLAAVAEEADFSRIGWMTWKLIDSYYDIDHGAERVDLTTLRDTIKTKYKKHFEQFFLILDDAEEEISLPNVVGEYLTMKEDGVRQRLAQACISNASREDVHELIEQLLTITATEEDEDSEILTEVDIEEVVSAVSPDNVIPVHPPELAKRLDGGFIPGNQAVIYANTEVGKSLLAISMTCHWLRNGYKVLYTGNEDAAKIMLLRIYSNLSGMTKQEIIDQPGRAKELAVQNGYNNLVFFDAAPGSIGEIRRAIEKYDPDIFVTDQMANMEYGNLSKVEKNEALAVALRKLAKKYNKVSLIVHQADNDAHGKLILEKNNMHFSNVGIQGQMDVMIGMGMNTEFENQNRRMLVLTKNKISGNHEAFPIRVNPEISEVVE